MYSHDFQLSLNKPVQCSICTIIGSYHQRYKLPPVNFRSSQIPDYTQRMSVMSPAVETTVISSVMEEVRKGFQHSGLDEATLLKLEKLWSEKLKILQEVEIVEEAEVGSREESLGAGVTQYNLSVIGTNTPSLQTLVLLIPARRRRKSSFLNWTVMPSPVRRRGMTRSQRRTMTATQAI